MKSSKRKGITLTELLVASILIGIVMVGVIAVSFAIKKMQETTNKSALLAMRMTAVITHMTKNVALAVGYQDDPGIVVGGASSKQWVSIRQEQGEPGDFTDDRWVIYYYSDPNLYFCTQTVKDGGSAPDWDGNCSESHSQLMSANVLDAEFTLFNDPEQYQFYLAVELQTIYDSDQGEDLVNNPTFNVESRMSPAGHSW